MDLLVLTGLGPDLGGVPTQSAKASPALRHIGRGLSMVMTGMVRLRNAFTIASHGSTGGHERHMITAPKHGPQRSQARRAILAVLRRAEHQRHRVSFVITMGDYTQWELGTGSGYDANSALQECHAERDDPYLWIEHQLHRSQHPVDANAIIGVGIRTWPSNLAPLRAPR